MMYILAIATAVLISIIPVKAHSGEFLVTGVVGHAVDGFSSALAKSIC